MLSPVFILLLAPRRGMGVFFYQYMPGLDAWRRPIYRPTALQPASYALFTDVVRHYYEQLHNPNSEEALVLILDMASENVRYGGYRPADVEPIGIGKAIFQRHYEGITSGIPKHQTIRFETIVDDGVNCLVEWTSVIHPSGVALGIVSQAGMAAYERDAGGQLASVRICDNLGFEAQIDRSRIRPEDQFVHSERQSSC